MVHQIHISYLYLSLSKIYLQFCIIIIRQIKSMKNPYFSINQHKSHWQITFRIRKQVKYGDALYICGSLSELGTWTPQKAVRLNWSQGHTWEQTVFIAKDIWHEVDFKFIISTFHIVQSSNIEWQIGNFNRRIDLYHIHSKSLYYAVWNREIVAICLNTSLLSHRNDNYFISGNIWELGSWWDKKQMQLIDEDMKESIAQQLSNDSQLLDQLNLTTMFIYTISVSREVQSFSYFFIRDGQIMQSETYPGRVVQLRNGKQTKQKNRIKQFDWQGCKIVIDESTFDNLIFQKMTYLIYLACYLRNSNQFDKLIDNNVTAVLNLISRDEDFSCSNLHIKNLCKEHNIILQNWTVDDFNGAGYFQQIEQIFNSLQNMLINGHRVCIHCSRKILKSAPINILYQTYFLGYKYGEAIELIRSENSLSQVNSKLVLDVFNLVNSKMLRGRTQEDTPSQKKNN